jgi:hypothetical protein
MLEAKDNGLYCDTIDGDMKLVGWVVIVHEEDCSFHWFKPNGTLLSCGDMRRIMEHISDRNAAKYS